MTKTLSEKIREMALKRPESERGVYVSVDLSNVYHWEDQIVKVEVNQENEETSVSRIRRVSMERLADCLSGLTDYGMVNVYTPDFVVEERDVSLVWTWINENIPGYFHEMDLSSATEDSFPYILGEKLRKSYVFQFEPDQLPVEVKEAVLKLIRASRLYDRAKFFRQKKRINVITKPEMVYTASFAEVSGVSEDSIVAPILKFFPRGIEAESGQEMTGVIDDTVGRIRDYISDILGAYPEVRLSQQELLHESLKELQTKIEKLRSGHHDELIWALIELKEMVHRSSVEKRKCDLDVNIAVDNLRPQVMENSGVHVNFSGDGDFGVLYETLNKNKKSVIVVSPKNKIISKTIRSLESQGVLSIHDPSEDDIWR